MGSGSANSPVTRDQAEVCAVTGGVMSQPLSARLPGGLRFLRHPFPTLHRPSLRSACRFRRRVGVAVFRLSDKEWVGFCLFSGGFDVLVIQEQNGLTGHTPYWFKPISVFGLSFLTEFINSLVWLTLPSSLAPFRVTLADSSSPHGSGLTSFKDRLRCPASFTRSGYQGRMWR